VQPRAHRRIGTSPIWTDGWNPNWFGELAHVRRKRSLPEDPAGYVGFQFRGRGYAAVSAIKLAK
jgi:hypothetical protein